MILFQNTVAILLIVFGVLLAFAGSLGLVRLPDFYTRTHASTKVDTMGAIFILLGLAVYVGFELTAAKLLIGVVFVAVSNPVAAHALSRAALRAGLKPWRCSLPPDDAEENHARGG